MSQTRDEKHFTILESVAADWHKPMTLCAPVNSLTRGLQPADIPPSQSAMY